MANWIKILAYEGVIKRTVLLGGRMAGTIMSFENCGKREVGYWIGDEYWGKDLATEALSEFLVYVEVRHPLQTGVAKHNIASVRVPEKCGFVVIGEGEYVLKLAAD